MVLYIKTGEGKWLTWRYSEPLPLDLPRVLTIQCDEGERDYILECLRDSQESKAKKKA